MSLSRWDLDQAAIARLLGAAGPVGAVVERATARVESSAKQRCPVDTGRLRASISRDRYQDGDEVVGIVGTNVDYAIPVEFGTITNRAQPFLRPALHEISSAGIQ